MDNAKIVEELKEQRTILISIVNLMERLEKRIEKVQEEYERDCNSGCCNC